MSRPPGVDPILASFERHARRRPDAPVITCGRRRMAAGDLADLARRLAGALPAAASPGRLIALVAPNGPAFLAGFLALRRRGCVALLLDAATAPIPARATALRLGAAAMWRAAGGWPTGPEGYRWEALEAPSEPAGLDPEVAVVKLTSGSTGAARGIVVPEAALLADEAQLARTMGLGEGERILAAIPLSHSYGLASVALPALLRGATLVVPAGTGPFAAAAAASEAGVTFLPSVPAYFDALVRLAEPPPLPRSLRLVTSAGAPLRPATAAAFRRLFGRPVRVFYGASECGGICFDREGTAGERGTVGWPVDGVRLQVQPREGGSAAAAGVLVVHSAAVASGYLPAADPRLGGGRFESGDLASIDAGEVVLLGRVDDLILVKGKKVDPREIERVLGELPGVEEVAAIGVPGVGGQVVRAVVACRPGRLSYEEVRAFCRARLGSHQVPRSLVLVDRLPRDGRGKLDRAALTTPGAPALPPAGGGCRGETAGGERIA